MLVIVFLVLSLGVGSLRNQEEASPVSSLHPALVTINQQTQGFLGVEKLVFLQVDGDYFVDQAVSRPSGLEEHSLSDTAGFVNRTDAGQNFQQIAYNIALASGTAFRSTGATPENTGVASFQVIDRDYVLQDCMNTMQAQAPFVSRNGQCISAYDEPSLARIWPTVNSLAIVEDFRCFRNSCSYERGGFDLSFSGVDTSAWNGAAISFRNRSSFRSGSKIIGLVCYFDSNVQRALLEELVAIERSKENFIAYGLTGFRLFQGDTGFNYYRERIASNARTSLLVSIFDPNKAQSVSQTSFHFDGIKMDGSLQTGIVFPSKEACDATLEYSRSSSTFTLGAQPSQYPSQILRFFEFSIQSGKAVSVFGVDRIEGR